MRAMLLLVGLVCGAGVAGGETVTVSAAASLKEAMSATCSAFEAKTGNRVELNFAASGPLESQIERGAPVDAFVAAAEEPVDKLIAAGLVKKESKQVIARNGLVLVVPAAAANPPKRFDDLLAASVRRIAIGQPETVPAGMYARQTLRSLKLFDRLTSKLVFGASVRHVLTYVQRDEVDAALVYTTDAREAGSTVRVVATAPPGTHEPIEYPAVVIAGSAHAKVARELIEFWLSPPAQQTLTGLGFEPAVNPR